MFRLVLQANLSPLRCPRDVSRSVGRLFTGVINAQEQGQFRDEASSIHWSSAKPEADRANTDQEPEKQQSPPPCQARALCEQADPGGFRVPQPPWHMASLLCEREGGLSVVSFH